VSFDLFVFGLISPVPQELARNTFQKWYILCQVDLNFNIINYCCCCNAQRNQMARTLMPASMSPLPLVCIRLVQQPQTALCVTLTAIQLQNCQHLQQCSLWTTRKLMRQQEGRHEGCERRGAISVSTVWLQTAANAALVGQCSRWLKCLSVGDSWQGCKVLSSCRTCLQFT